MLSVCEGSLTQSDYFGSSMENILTTMADILSPKSMQDPCKDITFFCQKYYFQPFQSSIIVMLSYFYRFRIFNDERRNLPNAMIFLHNLKELLQAQILKNINNHDHSNIHTKSVPSIFLVKSGA